MLVSTLDAEAAPDKIMVVLKEHAAPMNENDSLIVYFAGHIYCDKGLDIGYWIPTEGRETVQRLAAGMDRIDFEHIQRYRE